MTPAAMLVVRRAAEAWQPTTDELALHAVADEAAYVRAVCGTPWSETTLDDALRVKRGEAGRALRVRARSTRSGSSDARPQAMNAWQRTYWAFMRISGLRVFFGRKDKRGF